MPGAHRQLNDKSTATSAQSVLPKELEPIDSKYLAFVLRLQFSFSNDFSCHSHSISRSAVSCSKASLLLSL